MNTKSTLGLGWIVGALVLPVAASRAQTVTNIATGYAQSLFLTSDGSLWGMGDNGSGQFGNGTYDSTDRPEPTVTTNVMAIATGGLQTLLLKRDGSLWVTGDNLEGELGDGTYNDTDQPRQIVAGNVTAIATGARHSLFVKSDGSLWAMGANGYGQLGDGTYNTTNRPEQIVATNVVAAAGGYNFSLILMRDGSVWGVGENNAGEFGDGTYNSTNLPVQVMASNVAAIAAGFFHSLFLKNDGSLWAVGANTYGQLGDGTTDGGVYLTNRPEQVVSSNVTAIAAGYNHSLFLKSDGSLWAMGDNYYGQLGDGTIGNGNFWSFQPEEIVASNVTAIAAGNNHSLFLKRDGSLWGMGANDFGQLGLGSSNIIQVNIPVQIVPLAIPLAFYTFNIVVNGDFELGDFSYWDLSGNVTPDTRVGAVKSGYVHSGSYGAQSGPPGSLVYLAQTLPTTPGVIYLLTFWLDNPGGETLNEFVASWNGATLLDKTNLTAFGWTKLQFAVTAAGTNSVLQFGFRDDNGYLGLDDVSVVRVVQPAVVGISLSGTNLRINGRNGLDGVTYHTLMSTNLARPLNEWTPVTTNVLDADGDFTITVTGTVNPAFSKRFYLLQLQ